MHNVPAPVRARMGMGVYISLHHMILNHFSALKYTLEGIFRPAGRKMQP